MIRGRLFFKDQKKAKRTFSRRKGLPEGAAERLWSQKGISKFEAMHLSPC